MPLPLSMTVPLAGSLKVNVKLSPSASTPEKAMADVAVSSLVVKDVVVLIVGAVLTALIRYPLDVTVSKFPEES